MNLKPITPILSVSAQIQPQEVAALAAAGFKAIICNRPDGEGADQPSFAEIKAAAQAEGLQAACLPIVSGKVDDADAQTFGALVDSLPKPILAYCRSGTRSATLWSLAEFGHGGKILPSFPSWLIDGTKPSHLAWLLKEQMLPPIYWKAMLRGREWMAKPQTVTAS